jgi:flagellar motor switch protein FliM
MSSNALLRISAEGGSSRRGADTLDAEAPALCTSIRRALPFLVRRGVKLTARPAFAGTAAQVFRQLRGPSHTVALQTASGTSGHLGLDGPAIALLADGLLGGDGKEIAALRPDGFSPAQHALTVRLAQAIGRSIAERLTARFGVPISVSASSAPPADAVYLITFIEVGASDGSIVLALPRTLIAPGEPVTIDVPPPDPTMADAIAEVEIDVAVELGHISISVQRLLALRPGDTLVSDVPTTNPVTVRAEGRALFSGKPTAIGGRFAVRVERRLER